ncbi:MAG: hypothetical protein ACM3NQ_13070 [Bacteroidales bacterium]
MRLHEHEAGGLALPLFLQFDLLLDSRQRGATVERRKHEDGDHRDDVEDERQLKQQ